MQSLEVTDAPALKTFVQRIIVFEGARAGVQAWSVASGIRTPRRAPLCIGKQQKSSNRMISLSDSDLEI